MTEASAERDQCHHERLNAAWKVMLSGARALERAAEQLGPSFTQVLDLLQRRQGRIVVSGIGRSGQIAQCIVSILNGAGISSLFLHAADAAHGDLGAVTSSDVALLVSHSGATSELLLLLPCFDALGVPVVAIVGNRRSPLARAARLVLSTDTDRRAGSPDIAEMTSALITLALAEALANGVHGATRARAGSRQSMRR